MFSRRPSLRFASNLPVAGLALDGIAVMYGFLNECYVDDEM